MPASMLNCYKQLIKLQVETLKVYVEESGQSLLSKQEALETDLKETLKKTKDPEQSEGVIENFWSENMRYYSDFPCYFNESAFLIVYSFLEASLFRICIYARLDINSCGKKYIVDPPTKNYTYQSKEYLETKCGISLRGANKAWKKLDRLRDLRNFLSHNNLNLQHTRTLAEKIAKKKTINYINRVFKKPLTIDRAQKYKIENHQFILDTLALIEFYLFFAIDKTMKSCK